jgi:AcrR family transcriptional regulator
MARTVKPEAVAAKRKEILDATQRLVFTKGFEEMSIQDILDEVRISSGAFHHYFDSRQALLEALIERIRQESEQPLLPIIHDPNLTAIEKLQVFFDTLDRLRIAHKVDVVELAQIWYTDSNAIVRQKVDEAIFAQRSPLLTEIVQQGVQEGSFTIPYPEKAGEILLSLLQGMGNTHAQLLLSLNQEEADRRSNEEIITDIIETHAAYMDAIERVLGTVPNALYRTDPEAVDVWVTTIRNTSHS